MINITLPCSLYDWSETLTYDQICDTLFAVNLYVNNDDHSMFSKTDLTLMEQWMKRNDFVRFLKARELASEAYHKTLENEMFAREISKMPLKIPMSH